MADYYPLLARAVAALPDSTPEARRAIYERARKALLGQLRRAEPPVPEEHIQRENDALDAAAARIEAEQGAGGEKSAAASPPPAARQTPPPPPPPPPQATAGPPAPPRPSTPARPSLGAPPPAAPKAPTAPHAPKIDAPASERPGTRPGLMPSIARERIWPPPARLPPAAGPEQAPAPSVAPPAQASVAQSPSASSAPPVVARAPEPGPSQSRPTLPVIAPETKPGGKVDSNSEPKPESKPDSKPEPEVVAVPTPVGEPEEARKRPGALSKLWLFGRSRAKETSFDEVLDEAGASEAPRPFEPVPAEPVRPIAPQAPVQRTSNLRYWVFAAILLAVVGAIGTLAFRLRDNPEDFARVTHANSGPESGEAQSGKIVERIGAGPSAGTQRSTAQPGPGRTQTQQAPATAQQQTAPQAPLIPVAHRAALLIEAPDDPQRVKTYVGTVLWRIDRTAGAPPSLVAEIDLPEVRFKAQIRISKNTDPRLPASHTIDLRFTPAPDGEIPDVKEIDTLQMRAEDRPAGEALSGIPAAITSNYFLVGLSASDSAQSRNLDLMRNRGWFDLPMLLVNGKIAKITFEKGTTGDRMMNDVMAAWKSS